MKRGALLDMYVAWTLTACLLGAAPVAGAASAPANRTNDLRPLQATPQDIAEGKRLAQSSCAACHGISGVSAANDVPHIAGQRAPYLYTELRVYQAGGRGNTPMNNAVKFLSDDALVKVAAYYANQDPPPAAAPAKKPAAPKPDPISAGKAAAAGCAGCHGDNGVSSTPGMPSLVGIDPKHLLDAMNAYKSGQRKNEMMKTLVSGLSEAELNNISLFYATQPPGRAQTPSPGNQAAGKAAATACASCHGDGGVSSNATAPSLAGQDAQYLMAALQGYKDGSRSDQSMKAPAASLDEEAMRNLAAYYANQKPQPPKVRKPLATEEIAQRCDRCHGVNGNSTDPRSPALASQRADYLERVLHAYRKGERKSTAMTAMTDGLSEADIAALAAHYARQKARSVVYVTIPPK